MDDESNLDRGGRFVTGGKPGPGRPKGSRNKLGESFLGAMLADFDKHGASAIERVREEDPSTYVRVVSSVLPKETITKHGLADDMTDEDLDEALANVRAALALVATGRAGKDRSAHH